MRISVVVPVFNERSTIESIMDRIKAVPFDKEIVVVDDFSTDGTRDILSRMNGDMVKVIFHEKNMGKGAALRTGFCNVTNDIVIVQDADLEYDPAEYHKLIKPIVDGKADVVYGSRFMGSEPHRVLYFWHMIGNKILTFLSNMFTNLSLTDMETCYKVFRREVLKNITIEENRFGFEPEITAKLSKMDLRIYEV
ncbi:MAG TPA: glycosyltransferase family 2 protein, partial [Nitrospirota bacterium]|nr:glycosyltransferase family 2 protein [Nitrospirota bacterium]